MQVRPGTRLRSQVSEAEFVVIRGQFEEPELRAGGLPLIGTDAAADPTGGDPSGEVQIGKRYSDPAGQIEILCVKGGSGGLSWGEEALTVKAAKALPSSD